MTNYNIPHCCPVMHKYLELLRHVLTLDNNESAERFTPYLTKKNKQLNKINFYNTHSKAIFLLCFFLVLLAFRFFRVTVWLRLL